MSKIKIILAVIATLTILSMQGIIIYNQFKNKEDVDNKVNNISNTLNSVKKETSDINSSRGRNTLRGDIDDIKRSVDDVKDSIDDIND